MNGDELKKQKHMKTLKQLIEDPANRKADGSLTDEAYAQYQATSAAHPDGFVPDDELDRTPVNVGVL